METLTSVLYILAAELGGVAVMTGVYALCWKMVTRRQA